MTHHFVTVCVVCVLCATHAPCSAHNDGSGTGQLSLSVDYVNSENLLEHKGQHRLSRILPRSKESALAKPSHKSYAEIVHDAHTDNPEIIAIELNEDDRTSTKRIERMSSEKSHEAIEENILEQISDDVHDKIESIIYKQTEIMERLGQTELTTEYDSKNSSKNQTHRFRMRRHTDVHERHFMQKIFETYGDGKSLTIEGFERLLKKLGLLKLLAEMSNEESSNKDIHSSKDKFESVISPNKGLQNANDNTKKERCLNSKELLTSVANDVPYNTATNNSTILPSWLFERVCPVLLYQLAGDSSSERNGCISVPDNYKPVIIPDYDDLEEQSQNMVQVWVYSTISIVIISLCGLLGVAVIPVMGKSYYHQLLQFLVALAVGTLCGDALIHLLPHAMMSSAAHSHEHDSSALVGNHEDQHNLNMWKGFVAMIGLVLFFFTEKALMVLAEWRKHRQRRNKLPSRVRVMREPVDGQNSNVVGEKLCKHKYSSYPYCYGEITTGNQENDHNHQHDNHERPPIIEEEKPLTLNCNSVSKIGVNDDKIDKEWRLDDSIIDGTKKNNTPNEAAPLNESESYTVIIREHETKHHGHTHSHGHVHSAPESMSSVAWMVVMGDGLHNFTDGMAIGAAFSANIAGGFSTAIAVFCHELPHELGDFAVLLKAGMSAKQAVFYNVLSSVLCFFGMIVGVLLGSTPEASSWIFAAAAGMFIYIALVDMIPELSSSHSAQHGSQWQCILQGLGLCVGLGIMLVIALYEHDLQHIFSD